MSQIAYLLAIFTSKVRVLKRTTDAYQKQVQMLEHLTLNLTGRLEVQYIQTSLVLFKDELQQNGNPSCCILSLLSFFLRPF